jgi:hypothetical protein
MKNTLTRLGIALICLLGLYLLVDRCNISSAIEFTEKMDSLQRVNDSLIKENNLSDSLIEDLAAEDIRLNDIIDAQKASVQIIREIVIKEVEVIRDADSAAIAKFYNLRYPNQALAPDTLIALNKPVLVEVAADLIKYDGAVKEIAIKDSIISSQGTRISLKDSTITLFKSKEANLNNIIGNKDLAIDEWTKQYKGLQLENKKLKLQSKFQKVATVLFAGGFAYMLIK